MSLKYFVSKKLENILSIDNVVVEIPKDKALGDFSSPIAFSLAKEYKKSPIEIANSLSQKLAKDELFSQVQAVKGFLNFTINIQILNNLSNEILLNGYSTHCQVNEKILLEFVSANPTGPLHIGHARGAIVGESLKSLGLFLGYSIDSEYYVNDAGNQIALLGKSLLIEYKKNILNKNVDDLTKEDYYRGEHIELAVSEILEEYKEDIFLQNNFTKLCNIAKDKMLVLIKEDLKSLDIDFDYFVSEASMYEKSSEIMDILRENNHLYIKENKTWIKSSSFNDEKDRVVLKEDSSATYLAGDIIYHHDKFIRDYDRYINIWGADHHGYIARVKASIEFLGFDSNRLEILLSQMVSLLQDSKPYKMSKRKGNYVLLSDVVQTIGADALKFIFLSKKCDTHLEFDIDTLTKQDSQNPIFYVQYAHTRIMSLLSKSKYSISDISSCEYSDALPIEARELLVHSLMLVSVIENAFVSREVNKLIDFIYNLSSMYHSFYNKYKAIDSDNEKELLKTSLVVANCIKTSLSLIGITAKESM